MRWVGWVFCTLVALGSSAPAAADDFEILRGSETVGPATFTRWAGFYAGGQIGYSTMHGDFSTATQSLVAYALRNSALEADAAPSQWQVLGATYNTAVSYGAFAGYNTQWQDLILGIEANYNRAALTLHAPSSPITRTTSDGAGNAYSVNLSGSGSLMANDFGTLRLRAGWVAGNFLPYGFVGFALGAANTSIAATVSGEEYTSGVVGACSSTAPCSAFAFSNSYSANSQLLYGFTIGAGVDVALTPNIFLRAEFEWDQFNPPPGFLATIMTGRVGAGFKF
jgi:outer membrane immunogenic protein